MQMLVSPPGSRWISPVQACVLLALTLLSAGGRDALQAQTSPRIVFDTTAPAALKSAVDTGPLPASRHLSLTLTLASSPEQTAALDLLLKEQVTPSSATYRHWLTPAQFAATYGASPRQIEDATAWAQAEGLTVDAVSPSGNRITLSGFTSQIERAFAVELHTFQIAGSSYFASTVQPSLPDSAAALFSAIDGLDDLPATAQLKLAGTSTTYPALATIVDGNAAGILSLTSGLCLVEAPASQQIQYQALFRQAAAQGITTLVANTCPNGGLLSLSDQVTALALTGDLPQPAGTQTARPQWQAAPGLPADTLRHAPDLTASSLNALSQTLTAIASDAKLRLGNINPVLYSLLTSPGLYTQPDPLGAGTWEPSTGLGLVDLDQLAKVFPRGTGSSFTSFAASNYAPAHGSNVTFTSVVTSGTGGATPSGTVAFATSAGMAIGSGPLVSGTATYSTNTLPGGPVDVQANYSGDASYAASSSTPPATVSVQPEPSQLAATVSTGNIVGGTYTVAVTDTAGSGVGQPTGNVTVMLSGTSTTYTQTLAPLNANSSATTFTIPAATVGTATLSINCSGDGTYSCNNPLTKTVTIAKATPTLTFKFSPSPAVSGATLTFTASLTAIGNAGPPTGNVRFLDNGTLLNAGSLNQGATSTTGVVPNTATHSITATYDGDANYLTVSSATPANPAGNTTTTTLTTSNATPTYAQGITLTANVAAAGVGSAVVGNVTFTDSVGGLLGQAPLSNGIATIATSSLPGGASTITANYAGSGTYAPSASSVVSEMVTPQPIQITVTVPTNITYGTTFPVVIAVNPSATTGTLAPTGSIRLQLTGSGYSGSYNGVLSSTTAGGSASTTIQVQGSAAGNVNFAATYTGDRNYAAAGPTSTAASVTKTTSAVALTLNPTQPVSGQVTVLTARVTTVGSAVPTGTIQFQEGGTVLGSGALDSTGSASVSNNFAAGNHILVATYSGDGNYSLGTSPSVNTSTGSVSTTSVLTSSSSTAQSGANFTLHVVVTPAAVANGAAPSGTVQILDSGALLATAGLNNGAASTSVSLITVRSHTLTAVYAGDTNYAASTSPPIVVNVGLVTTTTSLNLSSTAIQSGQPVTLTSAVQPSTTVNGAAPTGTVTFSATTQGVLAAGVALVNGIASYTPTTALPAGVYQLTATYSGDANYGGSASTQVNTLTVTAPAAILAATISPTAVAVGGIATITATVTLTGATTPPIGVVVAAIGAQGVSKSGTLVAAGAASPNAATATIPFTFPTTPGTYTVNLACTGDPFTCNPVQLAVVVGQTLIPTSTVLTTTPTVPQSGQPFLLTATVTAATAGASPLSGSVNFLDGATTVGSGTIAAGVATASVTLTGTTAHTLSAVYSGDTLYATSTSLPDVVTPVLLPTTIALTTSSANVMAGSNVTLTVQVSGLTAAGVSPSGKVTFYVAGVIPRVLGSVTLGTAGPGLSIATLFTTSISVGNSSVFAVYAGDTSFASGLSGSVSVVVTDYGLVFSPPGFTLTRGQSASIAVQANSLAGFSGSISVNCTPAGDTEITCSLNPSTFAAGGSSILTIKTVAPRGQASQHAGLRLLGGASLAAFFCLLLPRSKRRISGLLALLLTAGIVLSSGCSAGTFSVGGTPGDPGTPLGTISLKINTVGTDGTTSARHDYNFQLTVQ